MPTINVGKFSGSSVLYRESGVPVEPVNYRFEVEQEYHLGIVGGKAKRVYGKYHVSGILQIDAKKRDTPPVMDLINHPGACTIELDQDLPWGASELVFTPSLVNTPRDGIFRIAASVDPAKSG